ncbi:MAG: hypothetical protein WCP95_14450 [Actinomycetes bacterium]
MTTSPTSANAADLGWPEDARQVADEADVREVSRETSTDLGWPEDRP